MPDGLLSALVERFDELAAEAEHYRQETRVVERRVASYETFEHVVRDSVSASFARAEDVCAERLSLVRREHAELTEAREALEADIARLRDERDALQAALAANGDHLHALVPEVLRSTIADVLDARRASPSGDALAGVADAGGGL